MNVTISTLDSTVTLETITSMELAQMLNKEHRYLLKDIRRYINQIEKLNTSKSNSSKINVTEFFIESSHVTPQKKMQPCYNITRKGCEFLANKLIGTKSTEFTARYITRFYELEQENKIHSLLSTVDDIKNIQTSTDDRLDKIENLLALIYNNQNKHTEPSKGKWSDWSAKMFSKYTLLCKHFNISNTKLYLNLYNELKNMYPTVDLVKAVTDYCNENNLKSCYTLEAIENDPTLRVLFENLVDNLLLKYNLVTDVKSTPKIPTIFD